MGGEPFFLFFFLGFWIFFEESKANTTETTPYYGVLLYHTFGTDGRRLCQSFPLEPLKKPRSVQTMTWIGSANLSREIFILIVLKAGDQNMAKSGADVPGERYCRGRRIERATNVTEIVQLESLKAQRNV